MRAFGMRLPVVLGTLIAVLGVLFGVQFAYTQRSLAGPLVGAVRQMRGVEGVQVSAGADGLQVLVRLGLVANLRETYRALAQRIRSAAGGMPVTIAIRDRRTPALVQDYYALNAIIQQGRVTGQFVPMEAALDRMRQRLGLSRAQVIVGNTHMYVELVAGTQYLYAILPLYLPPEPAASLGPGTGG